MAEVVSLEGPVEWPRRTRTSFPWKPAGLFSRHSRRESARSTASSCVIIRPWLAEKLRIAAGSLVIVDNANGKFTLRAARLMTREPTERRHSGATSLRDPT